MMRRIPLLLLALLVPLGCKREPKLRDIATLPHVERARGKVQPEKVAWAYEYQITHARNCYDRELLVDPNQRGTVTLTAKRAGADANVEISSKRTGTISAALESCIAWEFRAPPGVAPSSTETATLTLEAEVEREPTPPGDFAFRKVVDRMLEPTGARVLALEVHREPESLSDNFRMLTATCTAKVEFRKDGDDDWCGTLRSPGGPQCRGKAEGCECPVVKRKKGEQLELKGPVTFIQSKNGWSLSHGSYEDGRHFFGDETREE
jgi:hypothetical protein